MLAIRLQMINQIALGTIYVSTDKEVLNNAS